MISYLFSKQSNVKNLFYRKIRLHYFYYKVIPAAIGLVNRFIKNKKGIGSMCGGASGNDARVEFQCCRAKEAQYGRINLVEVFGK